MPSSLRPIFGSNLQPPDHLYSAEDVAAALKEYAHQNGLSGASEAGIKLDRFLVRCYIMMHLGLRMPCELCPALQRLLEAWNCPLGKEMCLLNRLLCLW